MFKVNHLVLKLRVEVRAPNSSVYSQIVRLIHQILESLGFHEFNRGMGAVGEYKEKYENNNFLS